MLKCKILKFLISFLEKERFSLKCYCLHITYNELFQNSNGEFLNRFFHQFIIPFYNEFLKANGNEYHLSRLIIF
jgi:hypothetical protein